jgi:hypothetical protein
LIDFFFFFLNDQFIIVGAYDRESKRHPIKYRLAKSLSDVGRFHFNATNLFVGPSITLTSVTDFIAFLVGSYTNLPGKTIFVK